MNEHLRPVFSQILPIIENAGIQYWVYGGIAFASMVGKYYRPNRDIDIFVIENDFEKLEKIIDDKCKESGWKICKSYDGSRPKLDLFIGGKERLSVIPVYRINEKIEFKFHEGSKRFSLDILKKVKRFIDGFEFYSPLDNFIKELFIAYLENRKKGFPSEGIREKRKEDARYILSEEEFNKYFSGES